MCELCTIVEVRGDIDIKTVPSRPYMSFSDAAAASHGRRHRTPPKDQGALVQSDFPHRWPSKISESIGSFNTAVTVDWSARYAD